MYLKRGYQEEKSLSDKAEVNGELYEKVWNEAARLRKSGKLLERFERISCPLVLIQGAVDVIRIQGFDVLSAVSLEYFVNYSVSYLGADRRSGVFDIDDPILAFILNHDFHLLPTQPSIQKSAALFAPALETELILDRKMYPRVMVRQNVGEVFCRFL